MIRRRQEWATWGVIDLKLLKHLNKLWFKFFIFIHLHDYNTRAHSRFWHRAVKLTYGFQLLILGCLMQCLIIHLCYWIVVFHHPCAIYLPVTNTLIKWTLKTISSVKLQSSVFLSFFQNMPQITLLRHGQSLANVAKYITKVPYSNYDAALAELGKLQVGKSLCRKKKIYIKATAGDLCSSLPPSFRSKRLYSF